MPVLLQPDLLNDLITYVVDLVKQSSTPITAVAALDSRGYLFGPEVARRVCIPFVQITKPGKLRVSHLTQTYKKEYGTDSVCMAKDALVAGANVLIIDDLLATGGWTTNQRTMEAAINLVKAAGANATTAFCVIELGGLNGRQRLADTQCSLLSLLNL